MKSIAKFLVACSCLVLLVAPPIKAAPQGYLEGHLKIVFRMGVEPDEMPRPEVAPESYAAYPLVILSQEGGKEVARLTADANGNYRAALPPGAYILDVPHRPATGVRATPQSFTVISNQTVRVDMRIFVGLYKGQA